MFPWPLWPEKTERPRAVLIASPLPTTLAGAVLHALADVTCSIRKHRCARLDRAASVEIGIRA